jgi:hypothetical protein
MVKIGVWLGAARDKYPAVRVTNPRIGVWSPSQPPRPAMPGKMPSPREENPPISRLGLSEDNLWRLHIWFTIKRRAQRCQRGK